MSFQVISVEKFSSIEPQVVTHYLQGNRWREVENVENHHSIWKLTNPGQTEYSILLPLDSEIPDFPNRMYDVVRTLAAVEKRSESELFNDLDSAARIAQEEGREILNLHLYFNREHTRTEAPAKKLGKLLASLQDTLDALGQFEGGRATPIGKISQEITDRTNVNVTSIFKGSFGIRLAASPPPQQLELLEAPLAEIVMNDFLDLLNSSKNELELQEIMVGFQRRAASCYRRFLLALTDTEANLRVEWGSKNPEKGSVAELSYLDAWRAIDICNKVETNEPEEFTIVGELTAVNCASQTFRIQDLNDQKKYFGKIDDQVFNSGIDPVLTRPYKTYRATIQQTLEEKPATGESVFKYKLLNLELIDRPNSNILETSSNHKTQNNQGL